MKIGFIGLGNMGAAIAGNLLKAGHAVTVWNRSPEPVQALVAIGAIAATTPQETLAGDVLFSMLASDVAIADVGLDGKLLDQASEGLVHVNLATISVALARELAAAHAARGLGYAAAPVFGRPDAAEKAQLSIVAAGAPETLAKLEPLFAAIGKRTLIVGAEPEKANLFKIAGNFMIASAMETMGEAFALLRKGGVDPAPFHELLSGGLFAGMVFQNYGKMILAEAFEPAGFKLKLGLKDVDLARDAAADLNVPMRFGAVLHDQFSEAAKSGMAEKDWSAVAALIAEQAGL